MVIYLILTGAAMITGFLDDCAKTPWGEYKKGFLDLVIAVMVAVTFLNFNSNDITILLTGTTITVPPVLFGILTVVLVWVSINVTNCSDGVDGLSRDADHYYADDNISGGFAAEQGRQLFLSDFIVLCVHSGISVVQCHAQQADDGGCRIPGHGAVYQHCGAENRKPSFVHPGSSCADPGRRAGTGEGFPAPLSQNQNPYQGKDPAS